MKRLVVEARKNWRVANQENGRSYLHSEGCYWNENHCYSISEAEKQELENATAELHRLCLGAVEYVVKNELYELLKIPNSIQPFIKQSWERCEKSVYGRFDLSYDGKHPPKLLEYNADTPTSLPEAGAVQREWMEEVFSGASQFNEIERLLPMAWASFADGSNDTFYFAAARASEEDFANVEVLRSAAAKAGMKTRFYYIDEYQWDEKQSSIIAPDGERVNRLFKLYPWEWIAVEDRENTLLNSGTLIVEPVWKALLSNKAILALLWELYPDHPNLLPTYWSSEKLGTSFVQKPLLSREGSNVTIRNNGEVLQRSGPYGAEGFIYQSYCELPQFEDRYAVIGSWVIGDKPAGIGFRESISPITDNQSHFVPHLVE